MLPRTLSRGRLRREKSLWLRKACPALLINSGKAPIVFGPDKVKLGQWYRLRLKLEGKQAIATLTETQDANPQVIEATLEGSAQGPVGIADFGMPVTFANFFVRE